MSKSWLPLEANPEVLTKYCRGLGLSEGLAFHDVLGVEAWALDMVPQPLAAILLLFPISAESEKERHETVCSSEDDLYFMKQTVGNACGTIAVLHAMLNLQENRDVKVNKKSYISRMLDATRDLTPSDRGLWLEKDSEIERAHLETEQLGQSSAPTNGEEEVDTHFIAFVRKGQVVYELDGRRAGPVARGRIKDPSEFGPCVMDVIKREFMERNPDDIRFNILALAPSDSE